jgi:hypothetical protein
VSSGSLHRKRAPATATSLRAGCRLPLPSNSIGFQVSHFCTTMLCHSRHVNRANILPRLHLFWITLRLQIEWCVLASSEGHRRAFNSCRDRNERRIASCYVRKFRIDTGRSQTETEEAEVGDQIEWMYHTKWLARLMSSFPFSCHASVRRMHNTGFGWFVVAE